MSSAAHARRIVVAAAALAGTIIAHAQAPEPNTVVEWEYPQLRVDGSALELGEIATMVIEHGACTEAGLLADPIESIEVAAPAREASFYRGPGPFCVRGFVVDTDGERGQPSGVATGRVPSGAAPAEPTITRVAYVAPAPAAGWGVAPRAPGAATNYVYRRTQSGGREALGAVAVGAPCDCSESFEAAWPAGAGTYCSVAGQVNAGSSTYVAQGAAFPGNAWTRCDAAAP